MSSKSHIIISIKLAVSIFNKEIKIFSLFTNNNKTLLLLLENQY